jgi:nucleotide-binding universal stress UspA family protein
MPAMSRILCPLDFSDFSRRALDHAATLARWYGGELHVLHVAPALPTLWAVAPTLGPFTPESPTADQEVALREALRPIVATGLPVVAEVRQGDPTRSILDYASSRASDLIVMGTHGRGGFERLVLGSVTEKVLRKAVCPVLTVCRGAGTGADGPPFKRILCAVDFTPASERGLGYALSVAKEADAELTLLHVVEPYDERWRHKHAPKAAHDYRTFVENQIDARLQSAIAPELRAWCRARQRIEAGRPWEQIVRIATEDAAQLIVMGQHSRSDADLLLFGSTTNQVVRHAPCPVLTTGLAERARSGAASRNPGGDAATARR